MGSVYDDAIWQEVADGEPPPHLVRFVSSLGRASHALDLGCGDGRLSRELDADELTLADVSAVALSRAARAVPGAATVEIDPDAPLPLGDNAFDLVVCTETIEHVRDTQLFLSEVRRVLAPGGRLALSTPAHGRLTGLTLLLRGFEGFFDPFSPHLRFYTSRSLRAALDDLGFSVESLRRESGSLLAVASR